MLVSVSIENWASFRDNATFSMVASKERQHGERLPKIKKYQMRLLPTAAVYGGNASGKTNFFKAISFARQLIVKGTQPDAQIGVEPFRLDSTCLQEPARFCFQILVDGTIYELSFAVTRKTVTEEKLVEIRSASEKVLYHRKDGAPNFDSSLEGDQFLKFAFQGTRDNQLFLTNSVTQKVERFLPIYRWFREQLVLIAPDSRFEPFERFLEETHPLYPAMNQTLGRLDTGIEHLGGDPVSFENLPLPDALKMKLQDEVQEGTTVRLLSEPSNERFVITRQDGELQAKKLVTYHRDSAGKDVKFEMRHESDGSQRVIDLVPAFLELGNQALPKVYVIDEVDRSLHSLMTRQLLDAYLQSCDASTRSQLIFTTHDVLLMDQSLLRRDEMWVAERDRTGNSSLTCFSDYKDVRYDKDIRKSYLQGRMGGVPRILLAGALTCDDTASTNEGGCDG